MNHEQTVAAPRAVTAINGTPNGSIVATIVPESRRMEFLPLHFGVKMMMRLEIGVYGWMSRLCSAYNGGLWAFIELSNGGAYMVPTGAEYFDLRVEGNGFDGRVSPDAAGVIATTFALNELIWKGHDAAREKYDQLYDFIVEHADREAILRAID